MLWFRRGLSRLDRLEEIAQATRVQLQIEIDALNAVSSEVLDRADRLQDVMDEEYEEPKED